MCHNRHFRDISALTTQQKGQQCKSQWSLKVFWFSPTDLEQGGLGLIIH